MRRIQRQLGLHDVIRYTFERLCGYTPIARRIIAYLPNPIHKHMMCAVVGDERAYRVIRTMVYLYRGYIDVDKHYMDALRIRYAVTERVPWYCFVCGRHYSIHYRRYKHYNTKGHRFQCRLVNTMSKNAQKR